MIERKKGVCSKCVTDNNDHEEKWLAKNKPPLCQYHYKQEQGLKQLEKQKSKPPKKRKRIDRKKDLAYSYKREPTGEAEVFREIWNERPHECQHCGKSLGNIPKAHFFAHIKSKKQHPELRLEKTNIWILCWDLGKQKENCHYLYDFGTKAEFEARKDLYRK